MSLLFYLTFIYFIFISFYYFIVLKKINYDNLFIIILNLTFLIILPLYFAYFKDLIYSLVISIALFISAFVYNLKIKEVFLENKILAIIYFFSTCFILGLMLGLVL